MTSLLEDPLPILFLGILVEAALGVALVRTGRGVLLGAMAGVLALVLAGVGLEWLVVTEREEVEATLDCGIEALEANDLEAVLACCSPSAEHTRHEARRALDWVEFIDIRITDLDITINRLTSPPTAKAEFIAMVSARDRKQFFGEYARPIGFTLTLRPYDGGWLVEGHELRNAPRGF